MAETKTRLSLRLEILEKMSTLAAASLGLVAALAWNDAIQSLFRVLFPEQGNLAAKFLYALGVTLLVVLVTWQFSRLVNALKARGVTTE